MARFRSALAATLALLIASGIREAAADHIIYDNNVLITNIDTGVDASIDNIVGEPFTLPQTAQITEFTWTGWYMGRTGNTALLLDSFSVSVFDFSGASPSATPLFTYEVGRANKSGSNFFFDRGQVFNYSTGPIPTTFLPPGRYLLSILNHSPVFPPNDIHWFWSAVTPQEGELYKLINGSWLNLNHEAAADFRIRGELIPEPEPASITLILLGILALGIARRSLRSWGGILKGRISLK